MRPIIGKRAFVPYGLLDPKQIREARRVLTFKEISADRVSHLLASNNVKEDSFEYSDYIYDNEAGNEVVINEFRETARGYSLPRAWATQNLPDLHWRDRTVYPQHGVKIKGTIQARDDKQGFFFENILRAAEMDGPQDILANATTGCHAYGTKILMYSGYEKSVQSIAIGDRVMGPDGKSRIVNRLYTGTQEMYEITPHRGGAAFVVNIDHVLSLVNTTTGNVTNIAVRDYLKRSANFKHLHKLYRTAIDYDPVFYGKQPVDPYILGLWLGDGMSKSAAITTMDNEIANAFETYALSIGCNLRKEFGGKEGRAHNIFAVTSPNKPSPFYDKLMSLGLLNNKHIPEIYSVASRKDRLSLLAGLVDTDGFVYQGSVEITQKRKNIALPLASIARSLGFKCSVSIKEVNGNPYYRLNISGDIARIPTRIVRKKCKVTYPNKNPLRSGFTISSVGRGDFYGFNISGDHLYLTADYTVHHNSGKTVAGIHTGWQLGVRTLIVVDSNKIAGGWLKNFRQFFGQGWTERHVGRVQRDKCEWRGKAFSIALAKSLARRNYGKEFYNAFGLLLCDEVQVFGGPYFSPILYQFPARVRIGFTATNRKGEFGKVIKAHLGKPRVVSQQEVLKPNAWILKNTIGRPFYALNDGVILSSLSAIPERNAKLAKLIKERGWDRKRNVLVLSNRTAQLITLRNLCVGLGVPKDEMGIHAGTYKTDRYVVYYKYVGSDKRNRICVEDSYNSARSVINSLKNGAYERVENFPTALYNRLQAGETVMWSSERENFSPTIADLDNITHSCQIIFATYEIFSKGVDVPRLDMGVEALPIGDATQPLGRVLRILAGKLTPEWYAIHDTVPKPDEGPFSQMDNMTTILNKWFTGKTQARMAALKKAGARIRF